MTAARFLSYLAAHLDVFHIQPTLTLLTSDSQSFYEVTKQTKKHLSVRLHSIERSICHCTTKHAHSGNDIERLNELWWRTLSHARKFPCSTPICFFIRILGANHQTHLRHNNDDFAGVEKCRDGIAPSTISLFKQPNAYFFSCVIKKNDHNHYSRRCQCHSHSADYWNDPSTCPCHACFDVPRLMSLVVRHELPSCTFTWIESIHAQVMNSLRSKQDYYLFLFLKRLLLHSKCSLYNNQCIFEDS